ncbi:uncharacterized protein LOC121323540 isoform X2 [Polyodon spathula]|uniref:uncharacterized protein LOC121322857 isoform X2 n=1 Tax=Polyodon spathula TaxID=7913 RepID=UPI001B7DF933|nr:uncharacterized protein LOC121322857 isoform X2 [Polyodon spathula]XP_041120587.1 uncharacterized protein LOC121323540 isoform X2 [Polyodon spathula]
MAMEILKSSREDLCKWLSVDPDSIIHKAEAMITVKTDKEIQKQSANEKKIDCLLEFIVEKEERCQEFLNILRKVQDLYPQLKTLFGESGKGNVHHCVQADGGSIAIAPFIQSSAVSGFNMPVNIKSSHVCSSNKPMPSSSADKGKSKGQSGTQFEVRATDGSNVVAPVIMSGKVDGIYMPINIDQSTTSSRRGGTSRTSGQEKVISIEEADALVPDKMAFLKSSLPNLVQRVKNIGPLTDQILGNGFSNEMVSNIRSVKPEAKQMRTILEYTTTKSVASKVFYALLEVEPYVMKELVEDYSKK